ncbi:MAG: signal peptide peptidase SppA [Flavobacteriales bacterium]|nr:signal peptide peptidase SppA [Flavobacteriales bacterium]
MKNLFKNILSFFRFIISKCFNSGFLRNTLSSFLAMIFLFVLVIVFIFYLIPKEEVVFVKDNSVLKIEFKDPVLDRTSENPFSDIDLLNSSTEGSVEFKDILDNIEKAKNDDKIKGIYLNFSSVNAGFSQIEEIRNKLFDFKESGKFIYSYADSYSQSAYYLASVSDKIALNPEGIIELKGLSAEIMFYKGLMDKLGIDAQIIRHGKFKGAVEPFMYNQMSNENREQIEKLLNSISDYMIDGIATEREGVTSEEIHKMINNMYLSSARKCLESGIIDKIAYQDQILSDLEDKSEHEITLTDYMKVKNPKTSVSDNKIAIIYATGEINTGKGSYNTIGSETTVEAIREASEDENVKAIVLRVNSPGGSALASEIIWREINLAKQKKKVVVSMGDYAASGGYYIACNADKIFANNSTLTGSIGVFGIVPNTKNFLNEKLGVYIETVKTHKHSDIANGYRKLSNDELNVIQNSVEDIYETFITHVSEGRGIPVRKVDEIGQGRVWSGTDALSIGLIDEIGGLEDAIASAADLSALEDYRIITLPKKTDMFEEFIESFSAKQNIVLPYFLGISEKMINQLEFLNSKEKIQARIPFIMEVH